MLNPELFFLQESPSLLSPLRLLLACFPYQAFASDPSNISFDEVLNPELVSEFVQLELAELAEMEAQIDEAEEEELWSLTITAQLKHMQVCEG